MSGDYVGFGIWHHGSAAINLAGGEQCGGVSQNQQQGDGDGDGWSQCGLYGLYTSRRRKAADESFEDDLLNVKVSIRKFEVRWWEHYSVEISLDEGPAYANAKKKKEDGSLAMYPATWTLKGFRPANEASIILFDTHETKPSFSLKRMAAQFVSNSVAGADERHPQNPNQEFEEETEEDDQNSHSKPLCHASGRYQRLNFDGSGDLTGETDVDKQQFSRPPNAVLELTVSSGCDWSMSSRSSKTLSVALRKLDSHALHSEHEYIALALIVKTACEILLSAFQLRSLERHRGFLKNSSKMVCAQILFDAFEGWFCFAAQSRSSAGATPTFFNLAVVGILKFVQIFAVELRWLINIWKDKAVRDLARDAENPTLTWLRVIQSKLKWGAVGLVVFLCVFGFVFEQLPESSVLLFLFFVPQCAHSAWYGTRYNLKSYYTFGLAPCRLVLPVLIWGSVSFSKIFFATDSIPPDFNRREPLPQTEFWPIWFAGPLAGKVPVSLVDPIMGPIKRRPNQVVLFIMASLVVNQVLYLWIQSAVGPRWGLPEWVIVRLPAVFDYQSDVGRVVKSRQEVDSKMTGEECVICMTIVKFSDKDCVTTPCEHFFHGLCLRKWMEVKMECPTCRGHLPPM